MFTIQPSISSQILAYLKKNKKWVSGGELEDIVVGHKKSSAGRIARNLAEDGEIKVEYRKVNPRIRSVVFYRI